MSDKFLLPCSCGQAVVVEARQAGATVNCGCGKSLEVPTIRELARLQRVEGVEEVLPPLWTLRQGMIFLGLAIALPAFAFTIYLYTQLPTLQESSIDEHVKQLSPIESWALWRVYSEGMPKAASPQTKAVIAGIHSLQRWINVGLIVGVAGLLLSAGALFFGKQKSGRVAVDRAKARK